MRNWLICYYTEKNDECTDLEVIIQAEDIEQALDKFKNKFKVYKRITSITEIKN